MYRRRNNSKNFSEKAIQQNKEKKKILRDANRNNFPWKLSTPTNEPFIKVELCPSNVFNPKHVHDGNKYSENLVERYNNGEKLNTIENLKVANIMRKEKESIERDLTEIKTLGFRASPKTKHGRCILLLKVLISKLETKEYLQVANIYLKLQEDNLKLTPELLIEYDTYLKQMNEIITKLDIIELQFTKFHYQMPPLGKSGSETIKLDKFQWDIIRNIDNNESSIVNAPTSAGKSVLAAYAATKGSVLFVVPTNALAWQMSAYIGNIVGADIPILTSTYQSNSNRDDMIQLINKSISIVGTPEMIVDFLPFIQKKFDWVVFDEVHMIGKPEGNAMEHIAKILPSVPIIALSATIRNTEDLTNWFKQLYPQKVFKQIICNKRFFNLQRFYYNNKTNSLESLNPLALVDESQIADESIINKNLQPTPPTTWDLVKKIKSKLNLGNLEPSEYFKDIKRIELDQANAYFYELIKLLVQKYKTDKLKVMEIINSYKFESLSSDSVDLIKLVFKLKEEKKCPTIIFQKNTMGCLRMARMFAKNIEELENKTYPKLHIERGKLAKAAKRNEKKETSVTDDKSKKSSDNSKKELKNIIGVKPNKKKKDGDAYVDTFIEPKDVKVIDVVSEQEPHNDFNLNIDQYFSEYVIDEWADSLKKHFPNTGYTYHYIIKLLWRGVGIYTKGLPDKYLLLVQTLASKKQLAVVFSDESLVFGVSMPFRTVVIIRDEKLKDDLEPMMFHQMCGRAGRRGLDKEGNVIFAGYSWKRIKELSISEQPIVKGTVNPIYTFEHATNISKLSGTEYDWSNVCRNYLDKSVTVEDSEEFIESIKSNYEGGWSFALVKDDINHLHMNWRLRYSEDSLIISMLIPYIKKGFETKDHTIQKNQIELAHFLSRFISTKLTNNPEYILKDPQLLSESPYNQIVEQLEELQIDIPEKIDNRVYQSIQHNCIVKLDSEDDIEELRTDLINFKNKVIIIQHFCFYSKIRGVCKIMSKLLTRIWWIYHMSSPIMKPINTFNELEEFKDVDDDSDDDSD